MRISIDTAFQAMRLLQHAKDNNMSGSFNLAAYMPLVSNVLLKSVLPGDRRLESNDPPMLTAEPNELDSGPVDFSGEDQDVDTMTFDNFMALMDGTYLDDLSHCGFDVSAAVKALQLVGASFLGDDDAVLGDDEVTEEGEADILQDILQAFGNTMDEVSCTETDLLAAESAFVEYVQCTGFGFLEEDLGTFNMNDFTDEMSAACGVLTTDPKMPDNMANVNDCLDKLFDHSNPLGKSIQNVYQNTGKICDCGKKLDHSMPSCITTQAGFPVSLDTIKTSTCVINVGCDALHDMYKAEVEVLDSCLPLSHSHFDCNEVMYKCIAEGSLLTSIPSQMSIELPDIAKEIGNEKVNERYLKFQNACANKKDYFLEDQNNNDMEQDALASEMGENEEDEIDMEKVAKDVESKEDDQLAEYLREKAQHTEEEEAKQEEERTDDVNMNEPVDEAIEELDQQQQIEELNTIESAPPSKPKLKKVASNKSNDKTTVSVNKTVPDISKENEKSTGSLTIVAVAIAAVAFVAALVIIRKKMATLKERKNFSQLDNDDYSNGEFVDSESFVIS